MKSNEIKRLLRKEKARLDDDLKVEMALNKTNAFKAKKANPFLAGQLYMIDKLLLIVDSGDKSKGEAPS